MDIEGNFICSCNDLCRVSEIIIYIIFFIFKLIYRLVLFIYIKLINFFWFVYLLIVL